jgi:hypothetical protein
MACHEVHVKPGGKLNDLCQVAISRIGKDMCNKIIYFIAGIPDICTMKRKKYRYRYHMYEESFLELDHVSNMKACILDTERQIKELGEKVVFATIATIATSSFHEWNFHRYSINKTDVLKFYEDYDKMQDQLNSVLREINQFITELNCKNNMVTPFLHTCVHKKKGGKIKYMFSKLIDGVHPTIDLSRSWFKHMEKVILENEKNLFVMDT